MKKSISLDDPLYHPLDEFCKCPRCQEWVSKRLKTCGMDPIGEGEDSPTFIGKTFGKNVAILFEGEEDGFISGLVITDLSTGNRVAVQFAAPPDKPPPKPGPRQPSA